MTVGLPLLLACAGPAGAPVERDSAADSAADPLPWDHPDEDPPPGALDAATLEAALAYSLALAPTLDPLPFFEVYLTWVNGATGGCPTFDHTDAAQIYWEGDCTSDRGFTFDGWGLSRWARDVATSDGGTCADTAFLYAFGRITDPEGRAVEVWGTQGVEDCVDPAGLHTVQAFVTGDFWASDMAGVWFEERHPVELSWSATEVDGRRSVVIDGGFHELEGPVYATWLDGLAFDAGAACLVEPDGEIRAWDTHGGVYAVTFDGSVACDGCGVARSGAREVGPVCLDFSPFYLWEDRPWW